MRDDVLIGVLVLIAAAAVLAAVLRAARIPGGRGSAAIAGGVLAGVLLGPVVMGRAAPDLHRHLVLGGSAQHERLVELSRDQGAEVEALLAASPDADAVRELAEMHAERRAPIEAELARAERRFAMFQFGAVIGLVGAAVLLAARCAPPAVFRLAEPATAVPVAMGAAFFAIVPTALVAVWLLGVDRQLALAIGAAVAAGTCLSGLPLDDPLVPDATPTSRSAGLLTCIVSAATLAIVAPDSWGWLGGVAGAAVLGYGLRLVLPRGPGHASRAIIYAIVVPAATGVVAVRIDPTLIAGWKPVLFVLLGLLLAGDGQLVGAWLGTNLAGPAHHRRRAHMLWIDAFEMGVPATQVALALVLIASGTIDARTPVGAAALSALLLGALAAELMRGPTRRLALSYHEELDTG